MSFPAFESSDLEALRAICGPERVTARDDISEDFCHVKGQTQAKRALEIAAAGATTCCSSEARAPAKRWRQRYCRESFRHWTKTR